MKTSLLIFLIVAILATNAEKVSFEGFKLYNVIPKTENEVNMLSNMRDAGIVDIWNEFFKVGSDVRVMVSPEMQPVFLGRLMQSRTEVKTLMENVQKVVDDQMVPATSTRSTKFLSFDWENYHNLEDIENWMDELVREYPNVVSSATMGIRSVENREIKGIVINYNPSRSKPLAMLEGVLHAREWISSATITWIVKEFLTSSDPDVRFMAENLEWHIFPVVNPDGYVYTFTTHRMWRKNRSRANFTECALGVNNDMSNGVDLNRNFDFFWMSVGASNDPCSNTFAGPSPASEPETQAIAQYVLDLKERGDIIYYLAFHSFTQLFILPYSHVVDYEDFPADNHYDLFEIANNAAAKLTERHNTVYRVGRANEVLYPMSGSSFDWVKYRANASVSYLIELRDLGLYGFLLPTAQIVPNNEEIMDALIEMDRTTRELGYYSHSSALAYSMSLIASGLIYLNMFN